MKLENRKIISSKKSGSVWDCQIIYEDTNTTVRSFLEDSEIREIKLRRRLESLLDKKVAKGIFEELDKLLEERVDEVLDGHGGT